MSYKKVYLKAGKEESLKRFHPWVFSGAIAKVEGEPEEGHHADNGGQNGNINDFLSSILGFHRIKPPGSTYIPMIILN